MTEKKTARAYRCPSCGVPKPGAGISKCLYCKTVSDFTGNVVTVAEAEMRAYYDSQLLSNVASQQYIGYADLDYLFRCSQTGERMIFT